MTVTWTAWATFAVVLATLVLAIFTYKAAAASKKAAEATETAAQASRDVADATIALARQAREDRELAWRPHLGIAEIGRGPSPEPDSVGVLVTNVGNGPALDCTFWAYRGDMTEGVYRWEKADSFLLGSGQARKLDQVVLRALPEDVPFPEGIFDPPDGGLHRSKLVYVITCTDLLGNGWRFVQGHPPEMVRGDDPSPPLWRRFLSPGSRTNGRQ